MRADSLAPASCDELAIRTAATAAIVAGGVYLTWRLVASLSLGTLWLGLPLLLGELWGFLQLLILTFQAWNTSDRAIPPRALGDDEEPVAVIITAHGAAPDDIEHTLLAADGLRGSHDIVVVDGLHRPEVVELAAAHGAELAIAGEQASDGFWHAACQSGRPFAAWLHAGHVPMPHFLERMFGAFEDPSLAVVQTAFGMLNKDSLVHVHHGRDEEAFKRRVVGPAMSRRGLAPWLGSGSMVRVTALKMVGGLDVGDPAAVQRTVSRLHQANWTSAFEPDALVFRRAPDTLGDYLAEHRQRAIEQLEIIRSVDGPLRAPGLSIGTRVAHVAYRGPFASGAPSVIATAVLIGALVSGAFPVAATVSTWLLAWAPFGILGTYARHKLGRGTMAYGDWVRHGWRTIGADASALVAVFGRRSAAVENAAPANGFQVLGRLRLLTLAVVGLDIAVGARASTILWHDLLPEFTTAQRVSVLGASLVALVAMVDVLQVIVRRKQQRADFRIGVDLQATIDDDSVTTIDLSVKGTAVRHFRELEVGQPIAVTILLPHADESESSVAADGLVRSCSPLDDGHWRVGIEFVDIPAAAAAALFKFCAIDYPMMTGKPRDNTEARSPSELEVHHSVHHGVARVATLTAAAFGVMTMLFGPATPSALAANLAIDGSVCLSDSAGDPLVGGEVSYYSSGWYAFGTTDVSGCVVGLLPDERTTFALTYGGTRSEITQDPAVDPLVTFSTVAVDVALTDSVGAPIAGAPVSYYANGWRDLGTTDDTGHATLELLAQRITVAVSHGGTRSEITQDTRTNSSVRFATVPVDVALTDSVGAPIAGAPVSYYANGWKDLGTTDDTGHATLELLAQRITVAVSHGGTRNEITQDTRTKSNVGFMTGAVTGDPAEVLAYYAGGWKPFTPGLELLAQRVTFQLADGSTPSFAIVSGQSLHVPSGEVSSPEFSPTPTTAAPTTPTSTTAVSTTPTPTTAAPARTTSATAAPATPTSTTAAPARPTSTTAAPATPTSTTAVSTIGGLASAPPAPGETYLGAGASASTTPTGSTTSAAPASAAPEGEVEAFGGRRLDTDAELSAGGSPAATAPAQPGEVGGSTESEGEGALTRVLTAFLLGTLVLFFARRLRRSGNENASTGSGPR